jgi:GNAT superfamily N-acetyltransferase
MQIRKDKNGVEVEYCVNRPLTSEDFRDVLQRSTLAERRPVDEPARIQTMLDNANLLITAWDGNKLVGVSRALTDFAFCCYLSDLAVDTAYQKQGIGKRLVELTRENAGVETTLILLAAPAAREYYPKIGMETHPYCFVIPREK